MVIDIHSHILPGIDDGAKSMDEAIQMLNIAVQEGIEAMVATPHYEVGMKNGYSKKCLNVYDKLQECIKTKKLPIELYLGNEIYYSESILELLQNGEIHTINGTPYVLVEFPIHIGQQSMERALNNLFYAGYWPIIAHAERYSVLRDVNKVSNLVRNGACIQVNVSAILGQDGWTTKHFCKRLMKKRLIHIVSTDAHRARKRKPIIKECLEYIEKKYGTDYRKQVSEDNPLKILKGERIGGKN